MVRARRKAGEREDDEVHQDVNEAAIDETAGDGVAGEEREARSGDEKERGPEERDGVVDGETECGHPQAAVQCGDAQEAARYEAKKACGRDAAETVEDEGVGDVERAGDEEAEEERFEETASVHCRDCRQTSFAREHLLQRRQRFFQGRTASASISTRHLGLRSSLTVTMVAAGRMLEKTSPWARPTSCQSSVWVR